MPRRKGLLLLRDGQGHLVDGDLNVGDLPFAVTGSDTEGFLVITLTLWLDGEFTGKVFPDTVSASGISKLPRTRSV